MSYCWVPNCKNTKMKNPELMFFRFPTINKPEQRRRWLKNCRINFEPTVSSRICSWHFPNGWEAGPTRFDWNVEKLMNFSDPETRTRKKRAKTLGLCHQHIETIASKNVVSSKPATPCIKKQKQEVIDQKNISIIRHRQNAVPSGSFTGLSNPQKVPSNSQKVPSNSQKVPSNPQEVSFNSQVVSSNLQKVPSYPQKAQKTNTPHMQYPTTANTSSEIESIIDKMFSPFNTSGHRAPTKKPPVKRPATAIASEPGTSNNAPLGQLKKVKRKRKKRLSAAARKKLASTIDTAESFDKSLSHSEILLNTLQCYRHDGFLCDTELITTERVFNVHSVVLSAFSPTFHNFFKVSSPLQKYQLHLMGHHCTIVETVLKYIYSGNLETPEGFEVERDNEVLEKAFEAFGIRLIDVLKRIDAVSHTGLRNTTAEGSNLMSHNQNKSSSTSQQTKQQEMITALKKFHSLPVTPSPVLNVYNENKNQSSVSSSVIYNNNNSGAVSTVDTSVIAASSTDINIDVDDTDMSLQTRIAPDLGSVLDIINTSNRGLNSLAVGGSAKERNTLSEKTISQLVTVANKGSLLHGRSFANNGISSSMLKSRQLSMQSFSGSRLSMLRNLASQALNASKRRLASKKSKTLIHNTSKYQNCSINTKRKKSNSAPVIFNFHILPEIKTDNNFCSDEDGNSKSVESAKRSESSQCNESKSRLVVNEADYDSDASTVSVCEHEDDEKRWACADD